MIFFVISIGVIILITGLLFMKEKNNKDSTSKRETDLENKLETQINEADNMLQELNNFSSFVKSELDNKYKELLFLYQLIEEKNQDLSNTNANTSNKKSKYSIDENSKTNDLEALQVLNNKNYDNIIKLHKEGKDISTIAKELNIGKGEVQLILGLAKMR
jgi:hypothetical protein